MKNILLIVLLLVSSVGWSQQKDFLLKNGKVVKQEKYDSTAVRNLINEKQVQLVSGVNLKTINGNDLLGSGNLVISGGGSGETFDQTLELGSTTEKGFTAAKDSASQILIGSSVANTWYAPTGDTYPRLSIEDTTGRVTSAYSPMINIASKSEGGIIWEFNPLGLNSDADAPYSFNYGIARDLQYAGRDDYSYTWGTNLTKAGGRKDTGQPSFAETIETQYEISGFRWALEHYTTMTAKDGTGIRPLYQIFNRDSLDNSQTVISSDNFRLQGGKYATTQGSFDFQMGLAGAGGTILSILPYTNGAYPLNTAYLQFGGTDPYTNKIKMKRPVGATGSGVYDDVFQYGLSGSNPMMLFGAYLNNAINGFSSGLINLAPNGLQHPSIYAGYWRVVDIGAFTARHGLSKPGAIQVNYETGTFYDNATGIEVASAIRFNNTTYSRLWSFGADANQYFINNTTDNTRVLNIANNGSLNIGNGTTIADASAIFDLTSTTKGFLPPRMTKTQRDAISSPATGLVIYQTDNTPGLRCYNGTNWMRYTETTD